MLLMFIIVEQIKQEETDCVLDREAGHVQGDELGVKILLWTYPFHLDSAHRSM